MKFRRSLLITAKYVGFTIEGNPKCFALIKSLGQGVTYDQPIFATTVAPCMEATLEDPLC